MKAKYAECSTQDNPVIYVETNYGGKTVSYNVNINEVDPNNASRLEMFALCSYADDVGIGDDSTFGTYKTLCSYMEMANHNGFVFQVSCKVTYYILQYFVLWQRFSRS
jgi:hypothetical protein